jgi:hypothetical protein
MVFSVMVSALKFLISGISTWDGSIFKGKVAQGFGVFNSPILPVFDTGQ